VFFGYLGIIVVIRLIRINLLFALMNDAALLFDDKGITYMRRRLPPPSLSIIFIESILI